MSHDDPPLIAKAVAIHPNLMSDFRVHNPTIKLIEDDNVVIIQKENTKAHVKVSARNAKDASPLRVQSICNIDGEAEHHITEAEDKSYGLIQI